MIEWASRLPAGYGRSIPHWPGLTAAPSRSPIRGVREACQVCGREAAGSGIRRNSMFFCCVACADGDQTAATASNASRRQDFEDEIAAAVRPVLEAAAQQSEAPPLEPPARSARPKASPARSGASPLTAVASSASAVAPPPLAAEEPPPLSAFASHLARHAPLAALVQPPAIADPPQPVSLAAPAQPAATAAPSRPAEVGAPAQPAAAVFPALPAPGDLAERFAQLAERDGVVLPPHIVADMAHFTSRSHTESFPRFGIPKL